MNLKKLQSLLAVLVLGVALAPLAIAAPPADKGKGANAAQDQAAPKGSKNQDDHDRYDDKDHDKDNHAGNGDSNHGQQVSDCNHRANERNLKGKERKNFVEWCTDQGARHDYDDRKYQEASSCYRRADAKGLSGDFRRVFLQECLRKQGK